LSPFSENIENDLDQFFSTFRKTVRTLLFKENFIRTTNTSVAEQLP